MRAGDLFVGVAFLATLGLFKPPTVAAQGEGASIMGQVLKESTWIFSCLLLPA